MEKVVLCGANGYEGKYYLNPAFNKIPESIKKELNISPIKLRPSFYNVRQLAILKRLVSLLETAINDVDNDEPIDLISVSIMSAYNASLDLLGEGNKNDLTDEIFSRFCVGK